MAISLVACDTEAGQKQQVGTLLGAVGGALAGSAIGDGKGQMAAIAVGTLLGAGIGQEVGKSLDRADQLAMQQTMTSSLETVRLRGKARHGAIRIAAITAPIRRNPPIKQQATRPAASFSKPLPSAASSKAAMAPPAVSRTAAGRYRINGVFPNNDAARRFGRSAFESVRVRDA